LEGSAAILHAGFASCRNLAEGLAAASPGRAEARPSRWSRPRDHHAAFV